MESNRCPRCGSRKAYGDPLCGICRTEDAREGDHVTSDLLAACEAFMRAPCVGSDGPGSTTIVVQDFNLRAARRAIENARAKQATKTIFDCDHD